MKKHLIAAAVTAAVALPAMAQNVTLFGFIDASVSAVNNIPLAVGAAANVGNAGAPGAGLAGGSPGAFAAGTATGSATALTDGQVSSSRWGMRGSEDLGGGLTALFYLESDIVTNGESHSSGLFRRGAYVGIASKDMGELTLGLRTNPVIATNGALMPVGGNGVGTLTSGGLGFSDFYTRNAVTYTTPNMGGVVLQGQWGLTNDATDGNEGSVKAGSATYSAGALTIRAAMQQRQGAPGNALSGANAASGASASSDKKTTVLGVSYQVNSALTLALASFANRIDAYNAANVWDLNGNQFGVGYQFSPAILLGYNYTTAESSKMSNLQARYALSKRTTAYAQYVTVDNGTTVGFSPIAINSNTTGRNQIDGCIAGGCGVLGAKQSSFGLGVMHAF
jgi:predicted porin